MELETGNRQPAERSPFMPAVNCQGRRLCHPPPKYGGIALHHALANTRATVVVLKAECAYFVRFIKYSNDLEYLFLSSIEKEGSVHLSPSPTLESRHT